MADLRKSFSPPPISIYCILIIPSHIKLISRELIIQITNDSHHTFNYPNIPTLIPPSSSLSDNQIGQLYYTYQLPTLFHLNSLAQLTKEEIATIEQAGAKGPSHPLLQQRRHLKRLLSLVSVSTLPELRLSPQFQEETECIGSDIDLESQVSRHRHPHGDVSTPGPVQKVIIIIKEKGGYVTVPNDEEEANEKAKKSGKEMEEKALIRDASLRIRIRLYIGTTIALWLLAFWMFLRLADPHSGSCHIVNNTSQRA